MRTKIAKEINELKEMLSRLTLKIERLLEQNGEPKLYNDELLKEYLDGDKRNE